MACPGGMCGKEGTEYRLIVCGILAALYLIGLVWVFGYHKTAYALIAVPVALLVFGKQISYGVDAVFIAGQKAWRASPLARRAGREYCPECAEELTAPAEPRKVPCAQCPKCEGSWCRSREMLAWLAVYGTAESSWRVIPRGALFAPMLCPQCAAPLEHGSLDRLQPLFARCSACDGHWISRTNWIWFALTPPPAKAHAVPAPT